MPDTSRKNQPAEFGWTRITDGGEADLPGWDLDADPLYYVEEWDTDSFAAYHGTERIGEPGTYGTRREAQNAAENAYLQTVNLSSVHGRKGQPRV